jgi:hypothetical protein
MKATIRDAEILRAIRPLELVGYLRANGWHEEQPLERGAFWLKESKEQSYELLLPLDSNLGDFANRMAEVLQVLERAEQRSQLEIVEDLMMVSADVIRPRLPGTSSEGSLSLEQGTIVYEQARNLMLAAACAAIERRPLYAKRKPEQAMQYLRHARFGPPKEGSYIVTIISPVPPKLSSAQDLFEEESAFEPFERRTVRVLAEALEAIGSAVREAAVTGKIDPMKAAVERGVSANLCEAILGLDEGGGGKGVEFTFSWSPSRGVPSHTRSPIALTPDVMPILTETARVFRETATVDGSEVIGTVQKLEHQESERGKVTVVGTADGVPRAVVMELSGEDRVRAIHAYRERIPVKCVGELAREGKSWVLRNAREFALLREAVEEL